MTSNPQALRDKAEEKFKKAEAGRRAMAEYEAEGEARRIKTAKLKKLRLAKEAAEATEETKKTPRAKKTAKKKT